MPARRGSVRAALRSGAVWRAAAEFPRISGAVGRGRAGAALCAAAAALWPSWAALIWGNRGIAAVRARLANLAASRRHCAASRGRAAAGRASHPWSILAAGPPNGGQGCGQNGQATLSRGKGSPSTAHGAEFSAGAVRGWGLGGVCSGGCGAGLPAAGTGGGKLPE